MARFQALTNTLLDDELEMLRDRLGLTPSQKAELLREVSSLAAWIVRQLEEGRTIEARRGTSVEPLRHPAVDRITRSSQRQLEHVMLTDDETRRLADVLDRPFAPTPALRKALANLASPTRRAPTPRWKKSA